VSIIIKIIKNILIIIGKPLFKLLYLLVSFFETKKSNSSKIHFLSLKKFVKKNFPKLKRFTCYLKLLGRPFFLLGLEIIKGAEVLIFNFKNFHLKLPAAKIGKIKLPKFTVPEINNRLIIILGLIALLLTTTESVLKLLADLPSPETLEENNQFLTTKIYDRSGVLLYKIYRDQNRSLVPLEKIPIHLIEATLAIEDKEFYHHGGLSLKGVVRAIKHNLFNPDDAVIGGSTITQQLVKNALLTNEKTWKRKTKEAILALMVEAKFSKDEILTMYLNQIPYGGTAYGVEEASQKYFGKHVWEINEAESAFLAGLTKAPTKYSPFGPYPERAKRRQEQVIGEMVKANFISGEQALEITSQPLKFKQQFQSIKAPHFVFYVKGLLVDAYGQTMTEQGGLVVKTSLDWQIQQQAEEIVNRELEKVSDLNITNGAALVIAPKTGEILAMVGSKNYFDFENDGTVNVALRPRQPGSAIKPINYAVALENGYTAATIIPDTPISYQIPGQPIYSPVNYDGRFHGMVSLRTALASSLNVPAVKVLSSYGVSKMIEKAQLMGITTWENPSRFGLALTLGSGEVKMIDLAQAYSVFANLGEKVPINPIAEIQTAEGKILYKNRCLTSKWCPGSYQALDPAVAFILNDILADNQARSLAFGANSLLKINNHKVAVKTGTTNQMRDNWTIGYTPSILTAVWVGNNDNSPMSHVASGISGATPIWHKIMSFLLEEQPNENWDKPNRVAQVKICSTTGTLPCADCPATKVEYFIQGTQPTNYCQIAPAKPTTASQSLITNQ